MIIELVLIVLAVILIVRGIKKPDHLPPGSWGLPLIGNLIPFFKTGNISDHINSQHKINGNVFLWRVGTKINIFLFDYQMIKETFNRKEYASRPYMENLKFSQRDKNTGIISSNGLPWHTNRKFAIRNLKDLGMGKSRLVTSVQYEATELVNYIKKTAGKPQRPPKIFLTAALNIIWQMVASHRYDYDDPDIIEFSNMLEQALALVNSMTIPSYFPWLKSVVPEIIKRKVFGYEGYDKLSELHEKFMNKFVEEHKKKLNYDNPLDYIDEYLCEMKSKNDNNESSTLSDLDLIQCMADIFIAGSTTTSVTLIWSMFYLTKYPAIQTKLQKEVDEVLPKGTLATLFDKPRLNYTEAFIHETHRYASLLHSGVMRTATEDTRVGGFIIPKDSIVFSMAEHCHFSEKFWEHPTIFDPERFLNSDGRFVYPKEGFFPFGIGKRQCMGESVARMELLIFLTALVQSFSFKPVPGKEFDIVPIINFFNNQPNEDQDVVIELR